MINEDLTPRERRYERTKDAILNATRKMIREGGVESVSMRKIAQEIDYSPAGLYEYFGSKEEIIGVLCRMAGDRLERYMKAVDASLPIPQRLVELGMAYIKFAVENREEFLLLFTYLSNPPQKPGETTTPVGSFLVLLQTVQEAIDSGFIQNAPFDAFAISYSAWALVHGMAMLQITALKNDPSSFESINRWTLEQFVKGLHTP
ncbi:MAG: TetR/AcrR family transcriptional regulator [Anaerolineales bacterium]